MTEKFKIKIAASAESDLAIIWDYISQSNPENAIAFIAEIENDGYLKNITAQLEFIEQYTKLKVDKSSQDRIYFADAVHPLHNSQPAYGWIKKGSEMIIQSNTGRERINLNGAYCIEDHRLVIKEANTINSQSTIELFKEMLKRQPLGFIYIILDNARYYRSKDVKEFLQFHPRLRLMFLPAYSPNLNIIERLWKFFKKNITYNAYYEDFDTFHYYCLDFF